MKLRWVKEYKTQYVPVSSYHDTVYKKQTKVETKLQYWDMEFSQWVDVPVETVREED